MCLPSRHLLLRDFWLCSVQPLIGCYSFDGKNELSFVAFFFRCCRSEGRVPLAMGVLHFLSCFSRYFYGLINGKARRHDIMKWMLWLKRLFLSAPYACQNFLIHAKICIIAFVTIICHTGAHIAVKAVGCRNMLYPSVNVNVCIIYKLQVPTLICSLLPFSASLIFYLIQNI